MNKWERGMENGKNEMGNLKWEMIFLEILCLSCE